MLVSKWKQSQGHRCLVICDNCGLVYERAFSYIKVNKRHFHNRKCMGIFRSIHKRGKNSTKFNKGVSANISKLRKEFRWYIAGLIDTDGFISIRKINQVAVGISNSNKEFLEYIKKICNGGKIYKTCRKGDKTGDGGKYKFNKDVYSLCFRKKEMIDLLPQIKDFLFIKKEKAIKAIKILS